MQNYNLKFKIWEESNFYGLEKITKINQKVHQERESENSQRGFGFEKTRGINFPTLSKISKTI